MAIAKLSGETAAGPTGLKPLTGAVSASAVLNNIADTGAINRVSLLSGVLAGGVCTASGLSVTVPAGTRVFAGVVWECISNSTIVVPDEETRYVWLCSDGILRLTDTTDPPAGFDEVTACLLTKAVSAGGVAAVDNSVQWRAGYADTVNRVSVFAPAIAFQVNRQTLTGNLTLALGSPCVQSLDAGGTPRDLNLPGSPQAGHCYLIFNRGGETLTVKNAGGGTVATLTAGTNGLFVYDGSGWLKL